MTVPIAVTPVVTGTAGNAAAAASATAAAQQEVASATQAAGAAATRAAAATTTLTRAETANTQAARALALAEAEVATAATAVTAAQVKATRAAAAVASAQRAVDISIRSGNAATIEAARNTLALAQAHEVQAIAALRAARAEAVHARTVSSVGTAAGASAASMLGLRGAVLTAGTAFLGATVAFQAAAKSIQAATDTNEELNKSTEVFGESSQQIKDFAETTASSLGISNVEALRATGIFGNLFRSINIGTPAAAEMSEALVRLAADLASFNNADPGQVLENLRSGLVGEPEPLRKFGIFLSQARAQQEALNASGKESVKQLTQQEIVQARFNIILRDSVLAQGDFARTSESLANQTRILKAEVGDLGAQIGSALIPPLTFLTSTLVDGVQTMGLAADAAGDLATRFKELGQTVPGADSKVASFAGSLARTYARALVLGPVLFPVTEAVDRLGIGAEQATTQMDALAHSFPRAGLAAREAAASINELKDVLTELSGLEVEQLEIQTGLTGGGRDAQIANLEEQIEADKRAVDAAASGSAARRKALEELRRDQAALAALEREAAQEAEAAADATKAAADAATRARLEADRALLDALSNRREDADRRAAAAAQTTSLSDDIRAQDRIQALIKQQIQKIRDLVKDERTRKEAIRELRQALIDSRREEDELRRQRAEQAAAQKAESINLDIEFAETTGNVAREVAARLRLIALLKKQQAAVKKGTLEWRRLRNEIAEQQAAIKEAQGQAQDGNDEGNRAAEFFFEQLQAQQGFAANLLGNLIPRDATGGLVGVPSPAAAVVPDVGAVIGATAGAAQGRSMSAPTSGQVSTTNEILLRILQQLKGLNSSASAPEAVYQKKMGAASMTGGGGNVEVM